jgi:hypothetical protein
MTDSSNNRVAVYIDFDNIVISRYSQVHPSFQKDPLRKFDGKDPAIADRLKSAEVDLGAILDYASSFGTVVISRAYADWSLPVNSGYRNQLIERAVDLVQMFPTSGTKNGADIRLAVDVVEDLFRLETITHVVIVAGDSDYISLAQRAKRLDRYVVGIGVAGATSTSLADACNEFADYDDLPGVVRPVKVAATKATAATTSATSTSAASTSAAKAKKAAAQSPAEPIAELAAEPAADSAADDAKALQSARDRAASLLERALRLGHEKADDEWLHSSEVKNQMKRMDPKFSEKAIGFSSFTEFVKSKPRLVDMREDGLARYLKLHAKE